MRYAPIVPGYSHMLHGGDYNPDQWLDKPKVIDDDFRLMKKAGCNTFAVGIFAWTSYERAEGRFDFTWLDSALALADKAGLRVIFSALTLTSEPSTATAVPVPLRSSATSRAIWTGASTTTLTCGKLRVSTATRTCPCASNLSRSIARSYQL